MTSSESSGVGWRERVDGFVEHASVQRLVVGVILANAAILGLQTTPWGHGRGDALLTVLDSVCLTVFVIELALKLVAKGGRFFRSGWNVFDLIVVAIALIPESGGLSVLRTLRVLRLISLVKRLRFVIEALAGAIPGLASIGALLGLIFYIGSVMATSMFGQTHPQWFGSMGDSAYTLFQVLTLESWSMGIVRPVMETHPWAWAFFIPFILLAAFTVLNLFVAVIVDSMQHLRDNPEAWPEQVAAHESGPAPAHEAGTAPAHEESVAAHEERPAPAHHELTELRAQVSTLQADLTDALEMLREVREEQRSASSLEES
ncbi:ion transporter [Brachybacterium sp. GCM10030267]|uniref:ion transporter n=1 Tax=Brachybacterium sp. GCM10030267 TaxID=3273381 RepID=UPI003616A6A7